jgi:hypothetical protein
MCGGERWPASNTSWIRMRAAIEACAAAGGRRQTLSVEYCHAGEQEREELRRCKAAAAVAAAAAAAASPASGGHRQVLAVSSCAAPSGCAAWIAELADVWRTTGDVQANWASITSNLDGNNENAAAARPGHYCDPDMLVLGQPGVSLTEAQTQFGAWALVAAPLLLSVDLTQPLPAGVLAIATNAEVIAVSQDAAQVQGVRVSAAAPDGAECWARPLAPRAGDSQTVAALLINRGAERASVSCSWAELGLPAAAAASVRDTYHGADLGSFSGAFAHDLDGHESLLVVLSVKA